MITYSARWDSMLILRTGHILVPTRVSWQSGEPWAVAIHFQRSPKVVTWLLARESLDTATDRPVEPWAGDVWMRPHPPANPCEVSDVWMQLHSDEGHAAFLLPGVELRRFLTRLPDPRPHSARLLVAITATDAALAGGDW